MSTIMYKDLVTGQINSKFFTGLVNRIYYSESNYGDTNEDSKRVKTGCVEVLTYPIGKKYHLPQNKVKLCDRWLQPGNIVRKCSDTGVSCLGYCQSIDVKVDVQVIGTEQVILGVNSKDLEPIKLDLAEVAVFKDSWVGLVRKLEYEVILKFYDGSKCTMSVEEACLLDDVQDCSFKIQDHITTEKSLILFGASNENIKLPKYTFYPGRQLMGPTKCFKRVKWLVLNREIRGILHYSDKNIIATVEKENIVSVDVEWIDEAYSEVNSNLEQPLYRIIGEDLMSLKLFYKRHTPRTGSKHFLVMKDSYTVTSLEEWKARMTVQYGNKITDSPSPKRKNVKRNLRETVQANNEAHVNPMHGKTKDSVNFKEVDDESGAPHKKRRLDPTSDANSKLTTPEDKLVTEVLITKTRADIVWQDGTVEENVLSTSLRTVYDYEDNDFFPGSYVVEKKESNLNEYGIVKRAYFENKTALVTWLKAYQDGSYPHPEVLSEEELSVYDIKEHPQFVYRPGDLVIRVVKSEDSNKTTAGRVVAIHSSGQIELSLVNGQTCLCYPQELKSFVDHVNQLGRSISSFYDESGNSEENSALEESYNVDDQSDLVEFYSYTTETDMDITVLDESESEDEMSSAIEIHEAEEPLNSEGGDGEKYAVKDIPTKCFDMKKFPCNRGQFSVLESVPDCHNYKETIFQPKSLSTFNSAITKEIKILASSLPDGINVKGFEDRMDLYSVLIEGPQGTPYEDGLFFFDLKLPDDYPNEPPLCHYISYNSEQLNPNLYVEGQVCVSLLGTWHGEEIEEWNPKTSNLLQVFVSIQGLILVSEPYFNEDGEEFKRGTQEGRSRSKLYNEMVILNLVEMMSKLLVSPQELFKGEVAEHFKTHSLRLIKRLEGWMCLSEKMSTANSSSITSSKAFENQHSYDLPAFPLIPTSKGFCLSLKKSLTKFKKLLLSSIINPN